MKKRLIKKIAAVISAFSIALCGSANVFADEEYPVATEEQAFLEEPNIYLSEATQQARKNVSLKVFLGTTYKNDSNTASTDIPYVDFPFRGKWNISFTPSYFYIDPLPIDKCTMGANSLCSDSVCGSNCTNDTGTMVHHKNAAKNRSYVENSLPSYDYDLVLTLVSTPLCLIIGNRHSNGVLGVSQIKGRFALVNNSSSLTQILRVRIIQHEISHLYGCYDGECTAGERCIMNGGFDDTPLMQETEIWCKNCRQKFVQNQH